MIRLGLHFVVVLVFGAGCARLWRMLPQPSTASGQVTLHNPETGRDYASTTFERFDSCVQRVCVESRWGPENCTVRRVGPEQLALHAALTASPAVAAAWLFGARARGTPRPDRDVDVAVLFSPTLDPRGRHNATLDVIEALTIALGPLGARADVLELGDADSAVAFSALRDGVYVVDRGDGVRA